jgi:hypothetical protein
MREYIKYYNNDRSHLGLGKEAPIGREIHYSGDEIKSVEVLNGLHHKYVKPVNYGQFVDNLMMAA